MSDFDNAISQAKQLAQTSEGRQLAQLLMRLGGTDLQQAVSSAAAGDPTAAGKALSQLLEHPEAKKLLERLGGNYGK